MPALIQKQTDQSLDLGKGLRSREIYDLVPTGACIGVLNVEFTTYPGSAVTRLGAIPWASVGGSGSTFLLRKSYVSASTGPTDYFIAQRGGKLYRALSTGATFSAVHSGLASTYPDAAQHDDATYIVNGTQAVRSSNGGTWIKDGNSSPQNAPTVGALGGGSASGDYYGAYSFVYGVFGESPISPISTKVTLANQKIKFSALSIGGSGVTRRRFYISSHSAPGTVYQYGSDGNAGATFSSGAFTEDDLLDAAEVGLSAAPLADRIEWHSGRMWRVPVIDRSQLLPSRAFKPGIVDMLDAINDVRDNDGAHISAIVSLSNDIMVILTETATWALYGASPSSWKLVKIYEVGMPRGAFRSAIVINGQCYWKSRRHFYRTNGYREGTSPISLDIERTVDSLASDTTSISNWVSADYRKRNWYLFWGAAGSGGLVGAASSHDQANDAIPVSGGGGIVGVGGSADSGVGAWNSSNTPATGSFCLAYDYAQNIWTVFSLTTPVATTLNGKNDIGQVHYFHSSGAVIRKFERQDGVYQDATSIIPARIRYAWKSEGAFASDKRMRRLWAEGQTFGAAGTTFIGLAKSLGPSTWIDKMSWSTQGQVQRVVLPMDMDSDHHQLYLGTSLGGSRFLLNGVTAEYKWRHRR